MKNLLCIVICFTMSCHIQAQGEFKCGTRSPKALRHISPETLRSPAMTDPIMVRLFVHICANSDGTGAVVTMAEANDALGYIENFFEPHGICFILVGINQVNNTDLMSVDEDDEDILIQFLVPDCINIFVHDQLFIDGESFGGRSWDIPNTYMSITDNNFNEDTDPLGAHELGHCFGLYHTHETVGGSELVLRTGACSNCNISGDLLCDTEADPYEDGDLDEEVNNCVYTDFLEDSCDEQFDPDPRNIMSYAPVGCYEYFTNGQGNRMRGIILDDSDLLDCVSPMSIVFGPATNFTAIFGWQIFTAHNVIQVEGINFEIIFGASGFFGAPTTILLPSVHFAPESGSIVIKAANPLCD